jgi:predicted phage replisome organizer
MAKRYYWLKLKDDFFTDKRIKKLRRIAGGDTYTIIYLKMMMKCMNNDGILEYEGIESSFADELALDLDEDADNVQITVNFLMQAGLLEEMGENHFLMTEVPGLVGS